MKVRTLCTIALLIVIALSIVSAVPLNSLLSISPQQPQLTQQTASELPRITLIKLWSVSHQAYMAKFVGEDYVVVFEGHGDASLDGKYVGVGSKSYSLYIYDVKTGELLGKLTTDSDDSYGDTWRVDSWKPFSATKVWDAFGFFSAFSSGASASSASATSSSIISADAA